MDEHEALKEAEARRQIEDAKRSVYGLALLIGLPAVLVIAPGALLLWGGVGIP